MSTDSRTAEFAKLVKNTYRDVNIALANEFSMICDELNIDVSELISLANHHPRVDILKPGRGVGGHCIAVDRWFNRGLGARIGTTNPNGTVSISIRCILGPTN